MRRHLAGALAALVIASVLGGSATATFASKTVTIGGPFTLIASDGTTVTDATYRGKWLLVFFGYTSCPDVCPTTLLGVAEVLKALGDDSDRVQPLFITVDPARDTPQVMGAYAAAFDPRIVGLTGSAAQVAAVADAYGAYSMAHRSGDVADAYLVDHSTYLYVMDPEGRFVRGFDHDAPSELIADALRDVMAHP